MISGNRPIGAVERDLAQRLEAVEIIGQLDLTHEEVDHLTQYINESLKQAHRHDDSPTDWLWQRYPCVAATFLVFRGVYHYQAGNFWGCIEDSIDVLEHRWQQKWGQNFLNFIWSNHLADFQELRGYKYVNRILGHGGIPQYCLEDFFEHVLWKAVTKPELLGFTAEEIIEELESHPSLASFADKPVIRFLSHGGQAAVDLLRRCLDMAEEERTGDSAGLAEQYGVPPRIASAFTTWVEEKGEDSRSPASTRTRFRKPFIYLDPYDGVFARLPVQRIAGVDNVQDLKWLVEDAEGRRQYIACRTSTVPGGAESDALDVPIDPVAYYQFTLCNGEEALFAPRRLDLWEASRSCLVFDSFNGVLIKRALPPTGSAFVVVAGHDPSDSEIIEELPPLPEAWNGYAAFEVTTEAEVIHQAGFQADEAPGTNLQGGDLVLGPDDNAEGLPVYANALPALVLPATARKARATLRIEPQGPAIPSTPYVRRFAEIEPLLQSIRAGVKLDLDQVLPNDAIGVFRVKWRILGQDITRKLARLPGLGIDRSKVAIGVEESVVRLTVEEGTDLEDFDACVDWEVIERGDVCEYRLRVPGQADQIRGVLRTRVPGEGDLDLTLELTLPHLSCSFRGLRESYGWDHEIIHLSIDDFKQSNFPMLLCKISEGKPPVNIDKLVLENSAGIDLWSRKPRAVKEKRARFDLDKSSLDVLLEDDSQLFGFKLIYSSGELQPRTQSQIVAVASYSWNLSNVQVSEQLDEDQGRRILDIQWEGGDSIKNRVVKFWNRWRPRLSPVKRPIPDGVNEVSVELSTEELEPGMYLLEFDVDEDNPWIIGDRQESLPDTTSPNTDEVDISPALWEKHLQSKFQTGEYETILNAIQTFDPKVQNEITQSMFSGVSHHRILDLLLKIESPSAELDYPVVDALRKTLLEKITLTQLLSLLVKKEPYFHAEGILEMLISAGITRSRSCRHWLSQNASLMKRSDRGRLWGWWPVIGLWSEIYARNGKLELREDTPFPKWVSQPEWETIHRNIALNIARSEHYASMLRQQDPIGLSSDVQQRLRLHRLRVAELHELPRSLESELDDLKARLHDASCAITFLIVLTALTQRLRAYGAMHSRTRYPDVDWDWWERQLIKHFPDQYAFELGFIEMEFCHFRDVTLKSSAPDHAGRNRHFSDATLHGYTIVEEVPEEGDKPARLLINPEEIVLQLKGDPAVLKAISTSKCNSVTGCIHHGVCELWLRSQNGSLLYFRWADGSNYDQYARWLHKFRQMLKDVSPGMSFDWR